MTEVFNEATTFNQPLNAWDTSNVTSMQGMFDGATAFNQPLDSWDTSLVTDMTRIFMGASSFNQDIGTWNIRSVGEGHGRTMSNMFVSSGLSQANYDKALIGWASQVGTTEEERNGFPKGVELDVGSLNYCDGEAARAELMGNHGWSIDDGMMKVCR